MWNELESFLKSNLHSDNHKQVHQCLLDCHKSSFGDDKSAEKVDLDEALNQLDSIGKCFITLDPNKGEFINCVASVVCYSFAVCPVQKLIVPNCVKNCE